MRFHATSSSCSDCTCDGSCARRSEAARFLLLRLWEVNISGFVGHALPRDVLAVALVFEDGVVLAAEIREDNAEEKVSEEEVGVSLLDTVFLVRGAA